MAHTKSGGSTNNLRDSQPKYRGVKLSDGQEARPGSILYRQTGSRVLAGEGVKQGRDFTLFAIKKGIVKFTERRKMNFNGSVTKRKVISVV
ncbi:MAG: 50S ribosomal protein L27 [Candidatus Ryanbacteria bacterium CG10_big_fil_rev_8_21_14_0_10_43_42]|uniref:Large ribosomal subunit protein bL27 n=1 Tax=Candidatus Ryanbacteria bacterium CG10_big_fil_rev_8_21_14_0_10_43_42 TaxID=1974864 RepID=A0A2M8KW46_9BACT|nr:MAG: 50S ribosomal protein L27 [Candidatus Ryanbacteria bacterium CG10_big_fil_rev_8_21_14_0_10_43_42]